MSMGKPTGSESWCLQVQVQYLIWHTCAYPWTCAMVSWVHHRYIMGSDLSVSTALFTLMAHGPQGDFLSPRIFSPFFIKQLSANFLHGTLIYWWLDIYGWNYQFIKLPVLSQCWSLFFRILSFNSGTWQIFLSIREVGDFENPNILKISYKLDRVSKGMLSKLLTMVDELPDTGSTRSLTILNKATLSKKAAGKAVKT